MELGTGWYAVSSPHSRPGIFSEITAQISCKENGRVDKLEVSGKFLNKLISVLSLLRPIQVAYVTNIRAIPGWTRISSVVFWCVECILGVVVVVVRLINAWPVLAKCELESPDRLVVGGGGSGGCC